MVCAVVVAPLSALTTSMPLPVVRAPSPSLLAIWIVVLPLALAAAPSSISLSLTRVLPVSAVPRRKTPALPT
ncbi:hypothetical protein D3C81_1124630 [compost metagenome]